MGRTFNFVADSLKGRAKNAPPAGTEIGLYMRVARASCGTISFNISRYFPATLACRTVKPVMLPPGRAMLATNPLPIGSDTATNTIGIVRVACINAAVTGVLWHWRRHSGFDDRFRMAL